MNLPLDPSDSYYDSYSAYQVRPRSRRWSTSDAQGVVFDQSFEHSGSTGQQVATIVECSTPKA